MTSRRQVAGASAVLLLLVVAFLWTPLTGGGYYASTDLLQRSPLLRVAPPDYRVKNPLLGDPVTQMHPWLEWNRTQLDQGHLGLWNPYDGAGAPHLASSVSAVLSPFSVPFYLLSFRLALVVAAGLKLFLLGLFTYLFLRLVRSSHLGALVAAVAFMFSAYQVVWLSWPHPGAAVALPAGLWLTELAFQAPTGRRRRVALCGLALALAGGLLAGHPETYFFAVVMVTAYALVRLAFPGAPARGRLRVGAGLAVAAIGAVGLSAVQLLPFAEYLRRSSAYVDRGATYLHHFSFRLGFLHVFPNLLGSPVQRYYRPEDYGASYPNYSEATGYYVGALVLFLAAVGVVAVARRRRLLGVFSAAAAAGWVVYAYDLGGLGHRVGSLPLARTALVGRSQIIWLFSISCLAGLGVDLLRRSAWASPGAGAVGAAAPARTAPGAVTAAAPAEPADSAGPARPTTGAVEAVAAPAGPARITAGLAVAAAGTLAIALAVLGARVAVRHLANVSRLVATSAEARSAIAHHVRFVSGTFLVGVAAAAALLVLGPRRRARAAAAVVLVGVVFAQGGFLLRDYNPTIDARYFYPRSPALAAVARTVGPDQVLLEDLVPADVNLWYRLAGPDNYDGLGVRTYDRLYRHLLGRDDPGRVRRILDVLGIRYVVSRDRVPFGGAPAPGLEPVAVPGPVSLFRVTGGRPRYFSPASALPVTSDDQAFGVIDAPTFDAANTVLIHGRVPPLAAGPGTVRVVRASATEVRLEVRRADPGWVVALQSWFPGWTATVNGRAAGLRRADVAFTAVPVGAGRSLVTLRYRPASVRIGLAITAVSLAVMVVVLGEAAVRRRPRLVRP